MAELKITLMMGLKGAAPGETAGVRRLRLCRGGRKGTGLTREPRRSAGGRERKRRRRGELGLGLKKEREEERGFGGFSFLFFQTFFKLLKLF
jgi:hypothetical protein